jgi:hypothetical protein
MTTNNSTNAALKNKDSLQQFLYEIQQQPEFRTQMNKCVAYYDDRQCSPEKARILRERGQEPSIQNLIKPIINMVLGMEAKGRRDWLVQSEMNDVATDLAIAINIELHKAEKETRADRAFSDAYASMIKAGIGWVHVGRNADPFGSPYRVEFIHRNEMFWDFRTRQQDMSDCRYVVRRRRYDIDTAKAIFPQAKAEIDRFTNYDRGQIWDIRRDTNIHTTGGVEALNNWLTFDDFEMASVNRKTVPIYEIWYREIVNGNVIKIPMGKTVEFEKDNPEHLALVQQGVQVRNANYMAVRRSIWVASQMVLDEPTPYKHRMLPYIKMVCFVDDASFAPYGLIQSAIPQQDNINDRLFKMNHLLGSKSIIYTQGVITDPNKVRQQASSPTAMIELNAKAMAMQGARFDIQDGTPIAREQMEIYLDHKKTINEVMGVYQSMLGSQDDSTSGVHAGILVEQGNVTLAEPNDNAEFARQLIGEQLLSLLLEDLGQQKNYVVGTEEEKRIEGDTLVLNQEVQDPITGEIVIMNDVNKINVGVVLGEVPSTPTYKAQQQQQLTDMIKTLPPELQALLIPFVIEQSDLQDKKEMADLIRKATGQSSDDEQTPEQQAQAQAQQQAQEMANQLQQAQLQKLSADVEFVNAQTTVKNVEALFAATQAAQLVAATPAIVPVADSIFTSAGGKDFNDAPLIQAPEQQIDSPAEELAEPVDNPQEEAAEQMPVSTSPNLPAKPKSPLAGVNQGIETPEND